MVVSIVSVVCPMTPLSGVPLSARHYTFIGHRDALHTGPCNGAWVQHQDHEGSSQGTFSWPFYGQLPEVCQAITPTRDICKQRPQVVVPFPFEKLILLLPCQATQSNSKALASPSSPHKEPCLILPKGCRF